MNSTVGAMIVAVMLFRADTTIAAEFQIKGLRLGLTEAQACDSNSVTRHQEILEATGVSGLDFPSTGCELHFDSLAGLRPSEPARLLFWRGRLIRVIVKFEGLELSDAAAFRVAFMDLYGKPVSRRNPPFRVDVWQTGTRSLKLEWTLTGGLPIDVSVYMTDESAWAEYKRVRDRADKAVEALDKKRRSDDILK